MKKLMNEMTAQNNTASIAAVCRRATAHNKAFGYICRQYRKDTDMLHSLHNTLTTLALPDSGRTLKIGRAHV